MKLDVDITHKDMKVVAKNCSRYGHPNFEFEYDERKVVPPDARWLVSYLEESVASGKRFQSGETLRIGWNTARIATGEEGRLNLLEPDWGGAIPIEYVNSMTNTLLHLRLQKDVAESLFLSEQLSFPWINQSSLICSHLSSAVFGTMSRVVASERDSGWFIGCNDESHDHNDENQLRRVSLYEVACMVPESVQFYALPGGLELVFGSRGNVTAWFDGRELVPKEGSYLDLLGKS